MIEFIDKTDEQSGTPINRENMMKLQGFKNSTINITESGSVTTIKEVNNDDGFTYTTQVTENADGSIKIVETYTGEKTIIKTTDINSDGSIISEVVS